MEEKKYNKEMAAVGGSLIAIVATIVLVALGFIFNWMVPLVVFLLVVALACIVFGMTMLMGAFENLNWTEYWERWRI